MNSRSQPQPRPRVAAFLADSRIDALLLFNLFFAKGFFHLEIRDGHCYGTLVDILNQGSKVMLLAIG